MSHGDDEWQSRVDDLMASCAFENVGIYDACGVTLANTFAANSCSPST